jgi:hypothetical protein
MEGIGITWSMHTTGGPGTVMLLLFISGITIITDITDCRQSGYRETLFIN